MAAYGLWSSGFILVHSLHVKFLVCDVGSVWRLLEISNASVYNPNQVFNILNNTREERILVSIPNANQKSKTRQEDTRLDNPIDHVSVHFYLKHENRHTGQHKEDVK